LLGFDICISANWWLSSETCQGDNRRQPVTELLEAVDVFSDEQQV
jgi:hypothetical protein